MKTVSIICLAASMLLNTANAQLQVSTKSFDLESINRNKNWYLYSGFSDANGNPVIKIGQSKCDQSRSGNVVTTYGLAWDFEELAFDKELNYIKSTPKSFANSAEAMQYEPIWGKTYNASNFSLIAGASLTGLTGADLGKSFVMVTSNAFGGSKISSVRVETEVKGVMNKQGTQVIGCNQYPTLNVLGSESVKTSKEQKWMHVKSFPRVSSCVSLFQVDGEGYPEKKMNYVLRKFNASLQSDKDLVMTFEYNNAVQLVEVETSSQTKDYVLVSQTCDKFAPKGLAVKEAAYAEIIYVDGNTFEIKFKQEVQLPYTKWYAREAVSMKDGSFLVFGPAGKDNKSYLEMPGAALQIADGAVYKNIANGPKNSPNLLMLKIKNNKVESLVANTIEDAQKVTQVVGGSAKKSSGTPIFNYPSTVENANAFSKISKNNRRIYTMNDKLIVCYQPHIESSIAKGITWGDLTVAIFDNTGKVEKMFTLPENAYANYEEYFSADNKKMYWITYDYETLNKETMPSVYDAKKVPNTIATIPHISVIDLSANTATAIQKISSEEWGVEAQHSVVANTENEIIFQGKSTSKKAKDSDLILIKVTK